MAPGVTECVFHVLVAGRMEDSRLLHTTRLLVPLTQKIKAQALYGVSLLNKHAREGIKKTWDTSHHCNLPSLEDCRLLINRLLCVCMHCLSHC